MLRHAGDSFSFVMAIAPEKRLFHSVRVFRYLLGFLLVFNSSFDTVAQASTPSVYSSAPAPLGPARLNATRDKLPPDCNSLLTIDSLPHGAPPPAIQDCARALYKLISPIVDTYTERFAAAFSYCVVDPIADRNAAFGFSQNVTFLQTCLMDTQGDFMERICGPGEIKVYIQALVALARSSISGNSALPILTVNCNNDKWPIGCEDGWASILTRTMDNSNANSTIFQDNDVIPDRTARPLPCCEGFFCPRGLTCMIPCPLGAFCPQATYNKIAGVCDPYGYQLSPGKGLKCGGANMWADVGSTGGIFCPAGNFCPTTTTSSICESGHYCRQGSTSQQRCFHLTSCDSEEATQNIKTYGLMLIGMLATLLLIVYNCSEQLMRIRAKRKEKIREAAALQVRKHINAVERWKMAAKSVKRMSHCLSQRHSREQEELQILAYPNMMQPDEEYPIETVSKYKFETINEDISNYNTAESVRPVTERTVEPSSMNTALEIDVCNNMDATPLAFPLRDDGKRKTSKKPPFPQSRSQIFKYAYGRIEKEKALQNRRMNWEDVVMQASQPGNHERMKLEISFKNLSLSLKGNGKKILCNVTGKLSPGRVTAVMGPSGAGKTTFLNALAGKAYNSTITGLVLINGKMDSIQAYKKIIGFVPQDDIVHGNLTVEENLWFSANYRLPVNMPKAEKVLVVERIIEALGLQHIRSSKAGTVEKRGISGGQRKRVNVGLEMVMEPSVLILDEPTSGLDSTSSQLVLKALRREAFVGVNVGVVLHQPSYGLFKMFDDVMLLAKGGHTVYLGPVDDVEAYFASMDIIVPERINPPDHYMNVLEGIAKPGGNPQFDPKVLPMAWMRHKGYETPQDSQTIVQFDATSEQFHSSSRLVQKTKSFAEELWEEFRVYLYYHLDEVKSAFSEVEDLSGRKTPGFFTQFKIIFKRVAKQRFRETKLQAQDFLILLLAGACLAVLSNVKDSNLGSAGYPYTIIALSLLCMIATLRTFALDKLQYWRESASSINRVAFFLAKDTVDHFNTAIKPLVYLSMFYFFSHPRSSFVENYIVTLVLVYCVVGISYIFAITVDNGPAQLWCVFFPIVSTLLAARSNPKGIVKIISYCTYARWAQEAYVIANAWRYSGVWLITRCAVLQAGGYKLGNWYLSIGILTGFGILARAVALVCLIFVNRNRQK